MGTTASSCPEPRPRRSGEPEVSPQGPGTRWRPAPGRAWCPHRRRPSRPRTGVRGGRGARTQGGRPCAPRGASRRPPGAGLSGPPADLDPEPAPRPGRAGAQAPTTRPGGRGHGRPPASPVPKPALLAQPPQGWPRGTLPHPPGRQGAAPTDPQDGGRTVPTVRARPAGPGGGRCGVPSRPRLRLPRTGSTPAPGRSRQLCPDGAHAGARCRRRPLAGQLSAPV